MTDLERLQRREKVIRMYVDEKKSINEISKQLKISWQTVKNDLLANNIEIQKNRNQYSNGNSIKDTLFAEISDADSAYWLGFLYADGNIRKERNEISLCLQQQDIQSIKDFHLYCNNSNTIREQKAIKNNKEYLSYVSAFSNKIVKNNLIKLGCVPKKSLILTFPSEDQVPQEYIYDFIRGYIDGDGYIQYDYTKHRYRIIICGTKAFLNGLVKRLNLKEHIDIRQDSSSLVYTLTISGKQQVLELLQKLYENSKYHLQRKYDIYIQALTGAQ